MSTSLLFEHDEFIAVEFFQRMNWTPIKYDRAIGVINGKRELVGTVFLHNWNGSNVEISYYAKGTMTVGVIRLLAQYIISQFNPARLTATTSKKNKKFIYALNKLGFRLEGVQRCWYGHRDCNRNTGVRMVMFRERLNQLAKIKALTSSSSAC